VHCGLGVSRSGSVVIGYCKFNFLNVFNSEKLGESELS